MAAANCSFEPKGSLRESPLKRALKSYIVAPIASRYLTVAIRVLWEDENASLMWQKRKKLEEILVNNEKVSFIFNCITAIKEKKTKLMVSLLN